MTSRFRTSHPSQSPRRLILLAGVSLLTGCQSVGKHVALSQAENREQPNVSSATTLEASPVVTVGYAETIIDGSAENGAQVVTEQQAAESPQSLRDAMALDAAQQAAEEPPLHFEDIHASVAQSSSLTLESIEALALGSHPTINEARALLESTRGQYVQAGLPFNPVLQYQSDEIGNDGASGLHSVQMSQQFVTANKLGIAQQVQVQEIQKRQAQLRFAELQVLTRVRTTFAQALVAQRRAELTAKIVELAEKSVASVESLVKAREVSRIALLQSRVEAENARIAAQNATTQLEASRRALGAATGMAQLPPGELSGDPTVNLDVAPWETLISEIAAASPEISEAGSELERARWSLRLACAQVVPNITGTLGVGVDAATDDTFARIGVSVPLPIRNRNQGNIRSARADIAAASAAIDRTQLSLDGRLAEAAGRYQVARERYERLQSSVIPDAEETFELSGKALAAGETGYLQLLTAQRTLFDTQLSVLDALRQAKQAAAEIEGLLVTLEPK